MLVKTAQQRPENASNGLQCGWSLTTSRNVTATRVALKPISISEVGISVVDSLKREIRSESDAGGIWQSVRSCIPCTSHYARFGLLNGTSASQLPSFPLSTNKNNVKQNGHLKRPMESGSSCARQDDSRRDQMEQFAETLELELSSRMSMSTRHFAVQLLS